MRLSRIKRRKLICLSNAMILAVCFFLPVAGRGCERIPPAYEEYLGLSLRGSQPRDFARFAGISSPYLFGLLVTIVCLCEMTQRAGALRATAGIGIFFLIAFVIGMSVYVLWDYILSYPSGLGCTHVLFLLWPLLAPGAWWILNAWRPRYPFDTKLTVWQFTGSLMAGLWFWQLILRYSPRDIYCGLWLSAFSSLVLLVLFADECKAALACSWRFLPVALTGHDSGTYSAAFQEDGLLFRQHALAHRRSPRCRGAERQSGDLLLWDRPPRGRSAVARLCQRDTDGIAPGSVHGRQ